MLQVRKEKGRVYRNAEYAKWKSGEDVFLWWMEDRNVPGQMEMTFKNMNTSEIKERREAIRT